MKLEPEVTFEEVQKAVCDAVSVEIGRRFNTLAISYDAIGAGDGEIAETWRFVVSFDPAAEPPSVPAPWWSKVLHAASFGWWSWTPPRVSENRGLPEPTRIPATPPSVPRAPVFINGRSIHEEVTQ